jgi:hypothetical protein
MADTKRDLSTPAAETPELTKPVTDLKSALADINTRTAARKKVIDTARAKTDAARIARSKERSSSSSGTGLYGLASFRNTTGKTKE